MRIDHACPHGPCALLERAMLDDRSTALDAQSDALPEWSA